MRRVALQPRLVRRRLACAALAAIVSICNGSNAPVIAQPIPSPSTAPTASTVRLPPGDIDPGRLKADQVAAMVAQMTDPNGEQEPRDLAARRLLAIGTNDARNALVNALRDLNNPGGRLAAARAVANDNPPGPEFVDPLFVLIDTEASPQLMDAAAIALGNYKSMPDVALRLVGLTDAKRNLPVRLAAIRGLSTQIEKRAAARLVELTQDPAVAAAATNALQAFTVLSYDNPADWAAWWRSMADAPDDRFRIETLVARMNRAQQVQKFGDETYQALNSTISAALNAATREQRGDVFARYLKSPREVERLIAIRRAYDYTSDPFPTLPALAREMLADVSPDVRYEAARIVQVLVDNPSFPALAQQAAAEPDARVRAKLADALGTLGNVEALPLLRSMLDDASNLVVQSAAGALEKLGPTLVQQKPRDADELAIRLQRLLGDRAARNGSMGGGSLRDAVVAALVPLKQRSLRATFANMLASDSGESVSVRSSAARGLAVIGDLEPIGALVAALNDPSPQVRIEVARAIGQLGLTNHDFNGAQALYEYLNPAAERDSTVRTAVWDAIRVQLPIAPLSQLSAWPMKPLLQNDHEKQVQLFSALAQRYADASRSDVPNKQELQIDALQHVGESQMRLGEAAERANERDEAARYFAQAAQTLDAALTVAKAGDSAMAIGSLTEMRVQALLRARDYDAAGAFVRSLSQPYREIVSPQWKLEGERLAGRKNPDDDASALLLISAADTLRDVLTPTHVRVLDDLKPAIVQRQNEKNQFDLPDWTRAVCMR